jgi:CRISPR/Cas system endoribonuclease Cas6 (RAMP superfamily)
MMEVHLQAFLDHFEKRLRRKDTRSLSRFIEQLNKHLREGYRGIYGYKLPEEFFTATEKALADGSLYPQSKR